MTYLFISFESESAYKLYHLLANNHKIKIDPCPGMHVTDDMMQDLIAKIIKSYSGK